MTCGLKVTFMIQIQYNNHPGKQATRRNLKLKSGNEEYFRALRPIVFDLAAKYGTEEIFLTRFAKRRDT